ncbi:MAG: EamA family transporter, partial [Clostridia bacterium]|nr:EamA family transporter [Clostridia bacterium]
MQSNSSAKIRLILSMTIFGTIGIFRNYIDLPSSFIAMARGIVGMLFLLFVILVIKRNKINFTAIKKNLVPLLLSGVFIGINWILLFEAYRHTTVSTATLCYYMAPIFVILLSPIIFKERFTLKKSLCALAAVVGMFTISGIFGDASSNITGILLGIGAAVFYASVILLNKFIKDIEDEEKTMVQLGAAGISILPYVLLTENLATLSPDTT